MKRLIFYVFCLFWVTSCKPSEKPVTTEDKGWQKFLNEYYDQRMKWFPLEATANGDNRYNDLLPIDFTDSYRDSLKTFYGNTNSGLNGFDRSSLNENDRISYDMLKWESEINLDAIVLHISLNAATGPIFSDIPFNQFTGLPLLIGQMGLGSGNQPFKTVLDYDQWIKRATAFSAWADSAIVYFKKGIASRIILPRTLVLKMIPQMQAMVTDSVSKNLFYGPISQIPDSFPASEKQRLTEAYSTLIRGQLIPAYKKLADFLKNDYLPKARNSSGIDSIPNGVADYNFLVRYWTTTNKTPGEIYNIGITEVKRIKTEMENTKTETGFKGSLTAFFEFMKTNKKFTPYKTAGEILNGFRLIEQKIDPNLKKMFGVFPKTKFEIRQTEAFRAASASAEYFQGTPDGSRPGIFYIPIFDPTKYDMTEMESLFLHEAIPGHHYQISIQQEDTLLPGFRRFASYGAYSEGWALYCESLGKELGIYQDPYQYMGALANEIHRAIRLVVDVGMHTMGMTREQAIQYMLENEPISVQRATAEVERYMAIPGQALSYKIGALKIRELRNRYENDLGGKFKLASFHDNFLGDGGLPLAIVETKMNAWEQKQK